nr:MAG: ORF1 [TTV-like mini virus]
MAPYRRRTWKNYRKPWRRRWFYRRRPKTTFRRRTRRHQRVRRRRHFKKKLKKITLKEWQPTKIRKCKITGNIQLFVCGKLRLGHDYTNYKESFTPVGEPSGGPWSIQLFTLDALFTEFIKHRCIWTKTNQGLPLARYTGCTLKFYKSKHTDYIVHYSNCPPFTVTREMYMNTQPMRQLLYKRKVIVPKLNHDTKKRYKKIKIRPPAFMSTKWYFQQDMCKTGLVLISATACSLQQPYCPDDQISYNYTFYSLNTVMFQNPCFEKWGTTGYIPKHVDGKDFHLFLAKDSVTDHPEKWGDVIPLGNTNDYTPPLISGKPNTYDEFTSKQYWENPFTWHNIGHNAKVYYTNTWPKATEYPNGKPNFVYFDEFYWEIRYNPDKDTGIGNKVYFKRNNDEEGGSIFEYPTKKELIIENYPLWLIFWGWIDFLARTVEMQEMFEHWFFIIETKFFWPKRDRYILLDKYFVFPKETDLTLHDKLKWHPKFEQQEEIQSLLAESGPFSPKINTSETIQANMGYSFFFKWGGCPGNMEEIISPCQQERFPIPNNEQPGFTIQDPKTPKTHYLYKWDEKDGILTKKASKRLKTDSDHEFSISDGTKLLPPVQTHETSEDETSETEESETPLQQQLQQLRHQYRQIQHQFQQLTQK